MKKMLISCVAAALALSLVGCNSNNDRQIPEGYVVSQEMTLNFEFGERTGTYTGQVNEDGLPDGNGFFSSSNEDGNAWTYNGTWDNGHWNSFGASMWEDGSAHGGFYENDTQSGYGVYYDSNGNVLTGRFSDSHLVGQGTMYTSNGVFFGTFSEDGTAEGTMFGNDGSEKVMTYDGSYFADVEPDAVPEEPLDVADKAEEIETAVEDEPAVGEEVAAVEDSATEENHDEVDTSATDEINTPTDGERNALSMAKKYLDVMPFSYSGLIKQLEYEGYTHEEAVYGADNCGADWNEQAVEKASKYLDIMSFSRSRLIDQLEYDGFTHDQAVYGADQNGM